MATEIKVPALGESVTEATVGQWFKKPGEAVKVDEPLVELETDKVTVEVPSPVAGVLSDIKVEQGTTVGIGSVLGSIKEGATAAAQPAAPAQAPPPQAKPAEAPSP
ncbi:MAG TPA: biotin/lipoyl-containing protein, partial [Hyphomicrobiaceae bacterium]|nr:biotin/lipoyl-containing protein [Hyphomicrobiaceae bacterium]